MNTTEDPNGGSLERMVRRRPKRAHDIWPLEGGGVLFFDRRIQPIIMKCDQCLKLSPNWAYEEGDGGVWCLECIEKWERKHKQHWEDGSPLKPPNSDLSSEAKAKL